MNIYPKINYLRLFLFPLSIIYGVIIYVRNYLYDNNILFKYKSLSKIISVGNINLGGSGKTPLVIKFAELLLERNFKIAIISRGYKRKTKGMKIVFDTNSIKLTVEESGDEPFMIVERLRKKYKNFYFIVSENRIEAIRFLDKKFLPDFIILDDALQQRIIRKDLDFSVIDTNIFLNHRLLNITLFPAGNLREPLKNLRRCTAIFQNDKYFSKETPKFLKNLNKPIFKIKYSNSGIYNKDYNCVEEKLGNIIAFCGIADPYSFREALGNYNIKDFIIFPDHKNYRNNDIDLIKRNYSKGDVFITTEKDFVKIRNFHNFIDDYPVYFIKLSVIIDKEAELLNLILNINH